MFSKEYVQFNLVVAVIYRAVCVCTSHMSSLILTAVLQGSNFTDDKSEAQHLNNLPTSGT